MQSIGDQAVSETGTSWPFAADYLASLEYNPDETAHPEPEAPAPRAPDPRPSRPGRGFEGADRSEPAQRIAESLCDIDRLTSAIEAYRLGNGPLPAPEPICLDGACKPVDVARSEEHTSELQSLAYLVCRLLLEKKKK